MSKKIYQDEQAGQAHVALQAMAMTMADYDFNYLRLLYADDVIKLLRESVDAIE